MTRMVTMVIGIPSPPSPIVSCGERPWFALLIYPLAGF
jgi:hypothetical protein